MLEEWKCLEFHPRLNESPNGQNDEMGKVLSSSLSKRTMILPIPEGCDENGCLKKKSSATQRLKEQSGKSDSNSMEMSEVLVSSSTQPNDYYPSESDLHTSMTLIQNIQKGIQSNAIFLKEPLKIQLEGPYGAPSSNIFNSEHAVLISTGIGVTPFASILQSIMYRHIEKKRQCPNCSHTWIERVLSQRIMNLKKVDFIWINRDQTSFEWFVELLYKLHKQQFSVNSSNEYNCERFLDIHMYVTGHKADSSARKSTLVLDKYKHSLNWKYGRPDWEQLFNDIRLENRGRVSIFYCGRPDLASLLRNFCSRYNFRFQKEVF